VNEVPIYSDIIAEHVGEETAWTPASTSPEYSPLFNGRLIQLKLMFAQTTAASVVTTALAKVECSTFGGRPAIVAMCGSGLQTAPSLPMPIGVLNCDLPVTQAAKLKNSFRHQAGAIAAVTSNLLLLGVFEG